MAKKKSWLKRTWDKLVNAYKSAPRAYNSKVSNKANKTKQAERKAEVKKKQEKRKREEEAKPASSQPKHNRLTLNNWNQRDRGGQAGKPETDRKEAGKKQEKNAFQKMIEDSKNGARGTTPAAAYQRRLAKQREELKKLREDQARKKAGSSFDDKPKMTAPYSNEQLKKMEEEKKRAEEEKKDRPRNSHSLTGMKRLTEKEGISAKKAVEEAKKERKKKKESAPKQMTTDEALRMQWASSNPTYKTKKGGDKLIDKDLQEKIRHNIQADYDRGSVGTGFMSGSMPVADLKKSVEKKYGIKLDDSKAKEHLGYNIAEMAGYLAKSTAFGGAAEESISKALTKVVLKKTGKKALGKAGKFAVNRSAEALAAAPVNLEDAAKNSENAKEFAQNVAANMALDAGLGSAVDGAKIANRFRKTAKAKTIRSAIHKTAKGQKLTDEEAKAFEGVKKRILKKEKGGKALNVQERLVNKAVAKSQAPAPAKRAVDATVQKAAKVNSKPRAIPSDFSDAQRQMATKAYVKYADKGDVGKYNDIVNRMEARNTKVKFEKYKDKSVIKVEPHHTKEDVERINGYLGGVNEKTLAFVEKIRSLEDKNVASKFRHEISNVKEREINDIKNELGIDVSGYKHNLKGECVNHIESGHGEQGSHNSTMKVMEDIARIDYVLDNYDQVKAIPLEEKRSVSKAYRNYDDTPSRKVKYEKRVDGMYYVVEAVPDSSKKKLQVVSAYIKKGKKKRSATSALMSDDPQLTSKTLNASASDTSISNPVKESNIQKGSTSDSATDVGPVPTATEKEAGLNKDSVSDQAAKSNPESPKIGDTVDDAAVKEAERSETMVDLDNDPAVRDIVANPRNKEKKPTGGLKRRLTKVKDDVMQGLVDNLHGVEVAAKRIGGDVGERLMHQANALRQAGERANYSLMGKQTDFNMKAIGKGGMEILKPIMKQGKETYADFNAYLFHRLNIDRFKNGKSLWGEDAVSPEKSKQIIAQMDDKHGDFSEAAEEVYQYFRNLNTVREQSGMISSKMKDALEEMYENYVPAYRNMNKDALEKSLDGSVRVNTGIRRAKGGDQAILPIEQQMAYATQQVWKSAELNQTIKNIAEAQGYEIKEVSRKILRDGDVTDGSLEDLLNRSVFFKDEKTGRHKATYFVNGVPHETELDEVVYKGLSNWKPSDTLTMFDNDVFKAIDKGLTKWNNLHKALITTYNAFFALRNGMKDMGDALWYAESGTNFIWHMPGAIKSMKEKDAYWQLWKASGGKYSGLLDITQQLNPSKLQKVKKFSPIGWIEAVNEAIEQYPRFVEFKSVLDKQLNGADVSKATKEMIDKASHAGADITCNFGRVGSLTKPLNRTAVPFLNASIQGADKMLRVIAGQKGVRGYVGLFTKLTAIGVAPGVAMEIMYANDESFQDFNARDKDNYFLLKDDSGAFWAIPRARGASTITLPAQMFTRKMLGNGELSADEFVQKWMNDVAPVSPFDASIFMPFLNAFRGGDKFLSFDSPGKTWYGGDIESRGDAELSKIERYSARTSKLGKAMSESMYKLIKKYSNEELAEQYTLSPKKIDHIIDSYSGIIGDVTLAATQLGGTQAWYHQILNKNLMKDPVYSNHLPDDYYDLSDELNKHVTENGKPKKGATVEEFARGSMLKSNNIALSSLRDLQNEVRMDKNLSLSEKEKRDRIIQKQINSVYRKGVDEKAVKAFDDFIKKHKDEYMTNKRLIEAARREYEKTTHATVKTMDVLYEVGGMEAVLKGSSSYTDDTGDKHKLKFSNDKTIRKIYKSYKKKGGSDDDFYKVYRGMKKANSERGIGTNSDFGNLAEFTIRTGGFDKKTRGKLREAFGVSKESKRLVDEYYKLGGSKKEYMKAAEAGEAVCYSVRQKDETDYNFFAPFKARGLAAHKLPDRAYMVVDAAGSKRKAIYYVNNSRGLEHYKISGKTLQKIDNKCEKNKKGYTTSEGLQKVLDKTDYGREEKALIWEALYGYSYSETNPYGSIRDFSLKSDVGIDTSGGWKDYGKGGYRRYGRRGYGRRRYGGYGGSGDGSAATEKSAFEKYVDSLRNRQGGIDFEEAKTNGKTLAKSPHTKFKSKKLDISDFQSDAYRKAVIKLLAKRRLKGG
ncbi:hypothetical protein D3Z38_09020 [Clostridiales bacterium]|nr:hypothetical protein [Clostridiales bacterium]